MEDLSDAIADCAVKSPIVIVRHVSLSLDHGRKVTPRTEELPLKVASITPLSGKDMRRLGEGQYTEGSVLIITPTELFTVESSTFSAADKIRYRGTTYLVTKVNDWTEHGNFYECVGTKVDR